MDDAPFSYLEERRPACRGRACDDCSVHAGGDAGGYGTLRDEAAHGASRLGNPTLRQFGRMH